MMRSTNEIQKRYMPMNASYIGNAIESNLEKEGPSHEKSGIRETDPM